MLPACAKLSKTAGPVATIIIKADRRALYERERGHERGAGDRLPCRARDRRGARRGPVKLRIHLFEWPCAITCIWLCRSCSCSRSRSMRPVCFSFTPPSRVRTAARSESLPSPISYPARRKRPNWPRFLPPRIRHYSHRRMSDRTSGTCPDSLRGEL